MNESNLELEIFENTDLEAEELNSPRLRKGIFRRNNNDEKT